MRVRLVRPLVAEIAQLDTVATDAAGYDSDFKEPTLDGGRREKPPVRVPAQVEFGPFDKLQQTFTGNIPDSQVVLVLDFEDLGRIGLIDEGGNEALLRPNDRITRILNSRGRVIEAFPNPPGMFITELQPRYGLEADRNLLLAFANDREQGLSRGL